MRSPPPLDDWGGSGPVLHLAHANGFPPGTYRRLIEVLRTRYRVVTLRSRQLVPGEDPRALRDWDALEEDLAHGLRAHGLEGALGVGHSVGGTCSLLASAAHPGLFRAVVALDPVLLTGGRALARNLLATLGLVGRVPPARLAHRRREQWRSREEAAASYRRKPLFADWDAGCFQDYLDTGLTPSPEGGFRLTIPRAWEARVFETQPRAPWRRLRSVAVPALVVRGGDSDTLTPGALQRLQRVAPGVHTETLPGTGHLLPFQQPEEVGRRILAFLDAVGGVPAGARAAPRSA